MDYPPARATVETLPNGLTLILDPDPAAPVVSTQLWVETGSIHEDQHLGSGISHFLEHMVFKGTRDFTGEELADAVPAAGGHWNAYTTFERTVYFIDGPSASMDLFLKCLTGLVFFPTLPEDEFEKEKDVIRHEIDMGLDDPDNVATRLALATIYQLDPRRHPVIGNRHRFDLLSHADLLDYQRRRYTTDRSFVVISGDFDPDEARAEVLSLTKECAPGCGREPHIAGDAPQIGPRLLPARSRWHGGCPRLITRMPRFSMFWQPCSAAAARPDSIGRCGRKPGWHWKFPATRGPGRHAMACL
jgi:zinc protease